MMQYMPDGSLYDLIHKTPYIHCWRVKLQLFLALSNVIADLHQHEVVHKDLKPGNLLMERTGNQWMIRICDLGLADALRSWTSQAQSVRRRLIEVRKTVQLGTLRYQPPECLLRPVEWTKAMDVYSMGIIFWEIAFGRLPYGTTWSDAKIEEAIKVGIRPDSELFNDEALLPILLRQPVRDLIEKCWSQNARDRPSADSVRDTVSDVMSLLDDAE